ncbi:aminoacetone oxidase family FAD-binding enzyme [Desulfobacter hydrogenophilus]|uniref:Aminoacetone oxidase family FAD-binding enzyme n=1 Tax=Desulfobacter hydrogenophilus TaxID=2291 RepID=A0A328FFP5_9BACT|nr:NAD(P)/FAD-dependent oxidoreductase [Desulfobacter hydrogenophilus]NDY70777.1 NAD(P)/FAD-dependent oxidoreductase [Desulfobacter hydrogenophilus]QBH12614.1 NAD(P)/FAD-dependent oxidoreductase [Desulfobacter hydrogenophilus]RAM03424.1 aminoacetone oxidase family FAD-binding enzyme [Desulfobacter hydrogenophilus]
MKIEYDVVIIGAGASGLMCAAQAGKRGRRVKVLDHGPKPGRKILMSGGGRCNFTNRRVSAQNYISSNPHFAKSALSRYRPQDFIALVRQYGISFSEREHGQLFCTGSAGQILEMLLAECRSAGVCLAFKTSVSSIERQASVRGFRICTAGESIEASSLVIATGGVSMPAAGATSFGYKVAGQFGIPVVRPRPGLVPFTLHPEDKTVLAPLAGISVKALVCTGSASFKEQLLFTHRGLSGPVILQASSFWQPGAPLTIDLFPDGNLEDLLETEQQTRPKRHVKSVLTEHLPTRLVQARLNEKLLDSPLHAISRQGLKNVADEIHTWNIQPGGTEGYRTAEVTVGGIDCRGFSSKTMESRDVPGLYAIGEVLDVTGWLGGYNFQWAWSSAWAAGQVV